jgi:hypothetical protein
MDFEDLTDKANGIGMVLSEIAYSAHTGRVGGKVAGWLRTHPEALWSVQDALRYSSELVRRQVLDRLELKIWFSIELSTIEPQCERLLFGFFCLLPCNLSKEQILN